MNWFSLITGPLLPLITSIGKFLGEYLQRLSYIRQGRNEQKLDDLKEENKNVEISKSIASGVDAMSDADLHKMFDTPHPNSPKKQ